MLADDHQAEAIKEAERRQINRAEGNVKHVEVFLDGSVSEPPSSEDLDPYQRTDAPTTQPSATPANRKSPKR
jgi:hypothetical protein